MEKVEMRKIDLIALGVLIFTIIALIGVFGEVKEINWLIALAVAGGAISFLFRYVLARTIVITGVLSKAVSKRMASA